MCAHTHLTYPLNDETDVSRLKKLMVCWGHLRKGRDRRENTVGKRGQQSYGTFCKDLSCAPLLTRPCVRVRVGVRAPGLRHGRHSGLCSVDRKAGEEGCNQKVWRMELQAQMCANQFIQ